MPQRKILVLDREESPWPSFFTEYFADTRAQIQFFDQAQALSQEFSKSRPNMVFCKEELLSESLIQKLSVERKTDPNLRIFRIENSPPASKKTRFQTYDESFFDPLFFTDIEKRMVQTLPFPESLRVLMVDDEPEIGKALRDYLAERVRPRFEIECALNGAEGLRAIERSIPDLLILDVKMPVMNGIELFREIQKRGLVFPVLVYFDAVFGDEVIELHKIGNPAILEKGAKGSSVADMTATILKMAYFG